MLYRLDDVDCVSARGHAAIGGAMAIQAVWLYDRAVDMAGLAEFHAALRDGKLGRAVAAAVIPAAGDRWTARAEIAPVEVAPAAIARGELEEWIAEQARAELRTYGGPAWRLAVARLDDGGSVVSLLVSHTIVDGRGLCDAVLAAVARERTEFHYRSDEFGATRRLFADLAAAAKRVGPALTAVVLGARLAAARRAQPAIDAAPEPGFRVPTLDVKVPARLWRAAAAARGGTATTLAVAVMAEIAAAAGRVDDQGTVRMMMPVSTRVEDDHRANALGSIEFEVGDVPDDLAPLRALMKEKLSAAAAAGQAPPPVFPVAVALPRGLYGVLARQAATDSTRTVCSNLGELDPRMVDIDGSAATSLRIGLINQSLTSRAVVAGRGGTLYGLFFECGDRISLQINAFHPPALENLEQLTEAVHRVLARYQLTVTSE
ncbi:hypothetical protein [Nocardia pseudobrasiliensis]|uniref:Condensation domain-containing protein n=1 Tax=Nocardia pseudobrasiliensis TaxID=45979 RepID=A0A370HQV8_9NOCA|nr:hypothetical protein [Nocardia pseudobrasiliensis]RDI60341.1 hypothetical protein DFR76_11673 [Nocardia pseudobrasiliensis]